MKKLVILTLLAVLTAVVGCKQQEPAADTTTTAPATTNAPAK